MMITLLSLAVLIPDPTQPRRAMTDADRNALDESIRRHGLLLPLRVRPADASGSHVIVSGHRRHDSLTRLGESSAPCVIVIGPLSEAEILEEQLVENLQRSDLSAMDEARGYERYMVVKQCTAAAAATALAISPARISRALRLLTLPVAAQQAVLAGLLAADAAYHLARMPEGPDRTELIDRALQNNLSRDEAARAAKKSARREASDIIPVRRVTCVLTGGRTLTISGSAIQIDSLIETLEEVLKDARKARTQGWDVTTLAKVFRDRAATGGAS